EFVRSCTSTEAGSPQLQWPSAASSSPALLRSQAGRRPEPCDRRPFCEHLCRCCALNLNRHESLSFRNKLLFETNLWLSLPPPHLHDPACSLLSLPKGAAVAR